MDLEKKDFFGKTVADAIKQACAALHAAQENLTIEVVETGSSGIFGFIRKKAHIRVSLQEAAIVTEPELQVNAQARVQVQAQPEAEVAAPPVVEQPLPVPPEPAIAAKPIVPREQPVASDESVAGPEPATDEEDDELSPGPVSDEPLSPESLDGVKEDLVRLLELMGIPSRVEIEAQGSSVRCHVIGDFQEDLVGQEGKVLDNLQYLLRKIVAKKISEKIRLAIDVGDFREKRQDELQDLARELAALVKVDGKTQIIPSLNPSERRVVHMALQDDKEIRSRSVGDGLFKKVLIYKPGSKPKASTTTGGGGGNGRKRSSSRGRRGKGGKPPAENDKTE